jgi:3-hydroxy acid dehydrogenase / malonic semialdehyde reductase
MNKMIDAKNLTVLVTGATAGFGEAMCRRFAGAGAKVIATGRRKDRLDKMKRELGVACHTAVLDVTDKKATDALVEALPADFKKVNVVVANAGLALGLEPAQKSNMSDWDQMVATNINGLLYTVRAFLPGMVERNEGHVVLLGSVAGDYPYPGGNVYGATKAFVKQFALNLRADILGANVRVTSVEPGLAETEFSIVRFKGDTAKARTPYENIEPMVADDIAEQIFFCCTMPRHVNINRIQSMATMQAFGPFAFKRG